MEVSFLWLMMNLILQSPRAFLKVPLVKPHRQLISGPNMNHLQEKQHTAKAIMRSVKLTYLKTNAINGIHSLWKIRGYSHAILSNKNEDYTSQNILTKNISQS